MEEIEISTLHDLENKIEELKRDIELKRRSPSIYISPPLFRGQTNASWSLETTIERFRRGRITTIEQYNNYLARLLPTVQAFTSKIWEFDNKPNTDRDFFFEPPPNYAFMIYARHHGFPSPLLDWSRSLYVALYFACSDLLQDVDGALFVYVPAPEGFKTAFGNSPMINMPGSRISTHRRHFTQQSQYTICTQKSEGIAMYCSHELRFNKANEKEDLLRKYILPSSIKRIFLEKLDSMNINDYTLFTTEDSLMKMLAIREVMLIEK